MSVLASVIQALNPLAVYKGRLPPEHVLPSLVAQIVAGNDEIHLRGDSSLSRRIVQLDAWASVETSAESYMTQAKAKLLAATTFQVAAINVSGAESYDADANLYRSSLEFTLWFST